MARVSVGGHGVKVASSREAVARLDELRAQPPSLKRDLALEPLFDPFVTALLHIRELGSGWSTLS